MGLTVRLCRRVHRSGAGRCQPENGTLRANGGRSGILGQSSENPAGAVVHCDLNRGNPTPEIDSARHKYVDAMRTPVPSVSASVNPVYAGFTKINCGIDICTHLCNMGCTCTHTPAGTQIPCTGRQNGRTFVPWNDKIFQGKMGQNQGQNVFGAYGS